MAINGNNIDGSVYRPIQDYDNNPNYINDLDPNINFYNKNTHTFMQGCKYFLEDDLNKVYGDNVNLQTGLSILSHNIRSVPKNLDKLTTYLNNANVPFSVIGLCETWHTQETVDLYGIPNYNTVHSYRQDQRGGGVSLYVHNAISFVHRTDFSCFNDCMECIFIEITGTDVGSNGNILVGLLYRPPSQSLVSFYEQLTQLMTKVTREKKKCYFMGDFNIDIPMDEHNNNTCTLLDIMYSMSFIPLITRPTRITSTSATFIDNIFCNILLNNNTRVNGVLYTDISDHLPVFTISECTQKRHGKGSRIINTRSFRDQNVCLFKALVGSIDWPPVLSQVDTQQSYSIFVDLINTAYDEAFPIRRTFIKNARSNPWITKSLKKCIKVKKQIVCAIQKQK